jgi:hypothetical protein
MLFTPDFDLSMILKDSPSIVNDLVESVLGEDSLVNVDTNGNLKIDLKSHNEFNEQVSQILQSENIDMLQEHVSRQAEQYLDEFFV